jgi:hypothetical protein
MEMAKLSTSQSLVLDRFDADVSIDLDCGNDFLIDVVTGNYFGQTALEDRPHTRQVNLISKKTTHLMVITQHSWETFIKFNKKRVT